MELRHTFTVPATIDDAWAALSDVERVAGCMPGASLDNFDGENFEGQVKVRVGPMQLTYRGEGRLTEKDATARRISIDAAGKEARGQGTAKATVTAGLTEVGAETEVNVVTNLDVTGKPAQFGRGAMADVGQKLLDRFAERLAQQLEGRDETTTAPGTDPAAAAGAATGATAPTTSVSTSAGADDDVLDLLDVAKGAIGKRLLPVAAVLVIVALLWRYRRHD